MVRRLAGRGRYPADSGDELRKIYEALGDRVGTPATVSEVSALGESLC